MNKFYTLIVSIIVILLVAPIVYAESYKDIETRDRIQLLNELDKNRERVDTNNDTQTIDRREDLQMKIDEKIEEHERRQRELRENFEERRLKLEEKREDISSKIEERKNNLDEKRAERILSFAERMIKRINSGYDRLERIIVRIESRIDKLEEVNKNIQTERAKELLEEAKIMIDSGKAELLEVELAFDDIIEGDTPKDSFEKVKTLIRQAVSNFKDAHKKIVEAIRSIKAQGGQKIEKENGGSEATTTNP